jgi:hypothetical protein
MAAEQTRLLDIHRINCGLSRRSETFGKTLLIGSNSGTDWIQGIEEFPFGNTPQETLLIREVDLNPPPVADDLFETTNDMHLIKLIPTDPIL